MTLIAGVDLSLGDRVCDGPISLTISPSDPHQQLAGHRSQVHALMQAEEKQIHNLLGSQLKAMQDLVTQLCHERTSWLQDTLALEASHFGKSCPAQHDFIQTGTPQPTSSQGDVASTTVRPEEEHVDLPVNSTDRNAGHVDNGVQQVSSNTCKVDSPGSEELGRRSRTSSSVKRSEAEMSGNDRVNEAQEAYVHMMNTLTQHSISATLSRKLGLSFSFPDMVQCFKKKFPGYRTLRVYTDHSAFILTVAIALLANIVLIVIDVHMKVTLIFSEPNKIQQPEQNSAMKIASHLFSTFFLIELLLRMLAEGGDFWVGDQRAWNMFDLVLVTTSIVGFIFDSIATNNSNSYIQSIRLLRLLRTFRVLRIVAMFRELRLMTLSIMKAVPSIGWAFVLIFITITIIAILILEGIATTAEDIPTPDDKDSPNTATLNEHFGDFWKTWRALFMAVSGGLDWWTIAEPLFDLHVLLGALVVFYVALMSIGMLNIITGIFVQVASDMAAKDRAIVTQSQLDANSALIRNLLKIFTELDTDGSEMITLEEFTECAAQPSVAAYFAALGLDITKSKRFFNLIDHDGSGQLNIEEFVMGCMRLQGQSKAIDFETLASENFKLRERLHNVEIGLLGKLELMHDDLENIKDISATSTTAVNVKKTTTTRGFAHI
eukprot:TRINITY_DN252_c0_g1_i1.p1 TRINITY_DN252_c0_g1~~TRINITY_DN252_c0_g1_i1.p1  ORF type:complete len:660 (-),score=90.00 TRINITY_DN252_c0_g1_i1:201-2180(-)